MTFTELCTQLGIDYRESGHEHCRKGWVQIDCPQCNHPGHFRLGYNIRGGYANCWLCGPQNIQIALTQLSGKLPKEIWPLIKAVEKDFDWKPKERITGKYLPPPSHYIPRQGHLDYLVNKRKFNVQEILNLWKIEFIAEDGGKLKWRILIPIHYQGRAVSWTTRAIRDDVKLRYISAKAKEELIDHKTLLYGEDYARHAIIICEGPTDVWRVGPGAVCTFGTGFKMAQVAKMVKYPVRVVCFDNEEGAQARAKQLCDRLEVFDGRTYNVTLKAKDPGSASATEIRELRRRFLDDSKR